MGLAGGIIAGALQGGGDAAQQVAAQQQKVWGQEDINKQLADLDVQKQASLMALQFQQRQNALNALYPATPAASSSTPVVSPQDATAPVVPPDASTPVSAPVVAPVTNGGLDPSKHSPEVNAYLAKTYPDEYAAGVADHYNSTHPVDGATPISAQPVAPTAQRKPYIWTPSSDLMRQAMSADIISPGSGAKLLEANTPDATGKTLLAQGVMPGSKEWNDGYAAKQFKDTSENVRPGGIVTQGGKVIFSAPADGVYTTYDDSGRPVANQVPNYAGIKAGIDAAKIAASNTVTLAPTDRSPLDGSGRVIPTTVAGAIDKGNSGIGVGLAPGQSVAADASQKELSDKWTNLNAQNQNAQSTISLLQNIKSQAAKAAVGPASDRIDYANGLLSLVGNQKATDAVTANDLLDKYSNQIVAKLGQGGLGTDAGRAIVAAGNPNSHMNLPAINEAVDNLVGATQQIQAKTALLAPLVNARDPANYIKTENAFDKAADPRIFQYMNMSPQQQAQYVSTLPADQIKSLKLGRDTLTQLGVFK